MTGRALIPPRSWASLRREHVALQAYIDAPARTPDEISIKLKTLRELLLDDEYLSGDAPIARESLANPMSCSAELMSLLDGVVNDVSSLRASGTPAASRIGDLDAFDRLTSHLSFVGATAETLRLAIENSEVELGDKHLHDAVATIAHLASEAREACTIAFHAPPQSS